MNLSSLQLGVQRLEPVQQKWEPVLRQDTRQYG
jgi:hypothetical protein